MDVNVRKHLNLIEFCREDAFSGVGTFPFA
jgi:hypothetical protein